MKEPTNTLQQLERTSKTTAAGLAHYAGQSLEWIAAFKAQATKRMMDEVAAYVAMRATWIRAQQGPAASTVISAMVADALADTFAGVVTWDPLRCPLAMHLSSVIRSRLSHDLERAEDHPHVNVDDISEHEVNEALLGAGRVTATKRLSRYVKEFTERLRAAAKDDIAVLKLIELHLQDITERRQICHMLGMKPGDYHNAFRRLKRLAEKLPDDLRAAVIEEIRGRSTGMDSSPLAAGPNRFERLAKNRIQPSDAVLSEIGGGVEELRVGTR